MALLIQVQLLMISNAPPLMSAIMIVVTAFKVLSSVLSLLAILVSPELEANSLGCFPVGSQFLLLPFGESRSPIIALISRKK